MTTQPDLFNTAAKEIRMAASNHVTEKYTERQIEDVCKRYHKGNPNSIEANKIARKGKVSARQQIHEYLHQWNKTGLTCEELERMTRFSHQSCSARLAEMRRDGLIKIVGTRKTRSGSPASVYQAV